jgi:phenylpyruvate tautomerase PptA (4-oxalocrotonate tautomerase family)
MPVANIHVLAGRPRPVLKLLLREVSRTYAEVLDSPIDRVQVWITEVDPELAAIGGVPADELLATGDRADIEIPLARLVMMENRPLEQVERALVELTEVISRVLGADPERVRVEAQSIAAERWGIGGMTASVKRRAELAARGTQLR